MRLFGCVFIFFIVMSLAMSAQAQQWQKIAPIHLARRNAGCAMLPDGRILVAGGSDSPQVYSDCEIYDPQSDTWSKTGSLNIARWGHTMLALPNGKILVVGGLTDMNVAATNTGEIYEPSTNSWRLTTSFAEQCEGPTAVTLPDGSLILFGTLEFNSYAYDPNVYQFDWKTETIQKVSTRPIGSWATECIYSSQLNGLFMTSGEIGGANGDYLRSTQFYSLANHTWTLLDSLKETVAGSQLLETDSGIYFVSGRINATVASKNVERFNVNTMRWEIAGTVPVTTDWGHSFQINNDTLLTVGGLGQTLNFNTPVSTSVFSISKGLGTAGPVMITPRTSECTIMAEAPDPQNPCVMQKVIYAFAGQDSTSNQISACEKLVVGTIVQSSYPVSIEPAKITHGALNQTVSYPLPVSFPSGTPSDSLLRISSSFQFQLTFDTAELQVAAIIPPTGWRLLSEAIAGNTLSASFSKLNSTIHTLDTLGSILFTVVDVQQKHAALTLTSFDLKDSTTTIPFCITAPEGALWVILLDSTSAAVSLHSDQDYVSEIYPNPSLGTAHIDIQLGVQTQIVVQVFDVMGREITGLGSRIEGHPGDNILTFATNRLNAGSYFFRASWDNKIVTREMHLTK
jgi:N-acetylneuraminic acid mutarotase